MRHPDPGLERPNAVSELIGLRIGLSVGIVLHWVRSVRERRQKAATKRKGPRDPLFQRSSSPTDDLTTAVSRIHVGDRRGGAGCQ
jgi:hypothetical protein